MGRVLPAGGAGVLSARVRGPRKQRQTSAPREAPPPPSRVCALTGRVRTGFQHHRSDSTFVYQIPVPPRTGPGRGRGRRTCWAPPQCPGSSAPPARRPCFGAVSARTCFFEAASGGRFRASGGGHPRPPAVSNGLDLQLILPNFLVKSAYDKIISR